MKKALFILLIITLTLAAFCSCDTGSNESDIGTNIEKQENYSIYYEYQNLAHPENYVRRLNKDGEWDFNISNNGVDAALQGGMALNQDGSLLAMGTEAGMVKLWSVEYDEEGAPSLTEMYTINWGNGAGNTMGVDFDAAGNLYIVSNSNERLMVYALPNAENTYTTRISLKPTTDVDNITTNQEVIRMGVYSVLGQYLGEDESGLPHGMYIINGKKVIK
jgi:hypothetical protein